MPLIKFLNSFKSAAKNLATVGPSAPKPDLAVRHTATSLKQTFAKNWQTLDKKTRASITEEMKPKLVSRGYITNKEIIKHVKENYDRQTLNKINTILTPTEKKIMTAAEKKRNIRLSMRMTQIMGAHDEKNQFISQRIRAKTGGSTHSEETRKSDAKAHLAQLSKKATADAAEKDQFHTVGSSQNPLAKNPVPAGSSNAPLAVNPAKITPSVNDLPRPHEIIKFN